MHVRSTIFASSINELVQKSKLFQCFVCLEQFDSRLHFPMQICQRQHFMCLQCVEAKIFKINTNGNSYACNLCSFEVEIVKVKRSPFVLSMKEFIRELIQRQEISKLKYKECITKQTQFAEELINDNILKAQKITQLETQIQSQEQLMLEMLENNFQKNLKISNHQEQPINHQKQLQPLIKTIFKNKKIGKSSIPEYFQSMLQQIDQMKDELQTENISQDERKKRLEQIRKHQNYLYDIIEESENSQISEYLKTSQIKQSHININSSNNQQSGYPNL